mmetsp:Transcript_33633/g.76895  ORF Transcript_33633/g.76895 Transcript_33633/m.76895 type:complete len:232 (-) Transcript_33633:140-835(-)
MSCTPATRSSASSSAKRESASGPSTSDTPRRNAIIWSFTESTTLYPAYASTYSLRFASVTFLSLPPLTNSTSLVLPPPTIASRAWAAAAACFSPTVRAVFGPGVEGDCRGTYAGGGSSSSESWIITACSCEAPPSTARDALLECWFPLMDAGCLAGETACSALEASPSGACLASSEDGRTSFTTVGAHSSVMEKNVSPMSSSAFFVVRSHVRLLWSAGSKSSRRSILALNA